MTHSVLKAYLLTLISFFMVLTGKAGELDRIQKAIEKQDYEKAIKVIEKSLEKKSINPGARYFYALLYYQEKSPITLLDSARVYINSALDDFANSDVETIDELTEARISLADLESLKTLITEKAFSKAKAEMTVSSLVSFLSNFPESTLRNQAIFLRDSIAFTQAKAKNTWEAFEAFMLAYPESSFADKAQQKYQQLLFKDYTEGDKLSDYITYLEDHPGTPYRREVEEIIFRRSTVEHSWESYEWFLRKYPNATPSKKAADLLYHLSKEKGFDQIQWLLQVHPNSDSLRQVYEKEANSYVPYLENGLFGFMDTKGLIHIPPTFDHVDETLKCGNISEDWLLVTKDGQPITVNKIGQTIVSDASKFQAVGNSFVLTSQGGLYHRSGFKIIHQEILAANVIQSRYIAFQNNNFQWGIISVSGMEILDARYDYIESIGNFIVLSKDDTYSFSNLEWIKDQEILAEGFDDYEIVGDSLLLAYSGDLESLYDQNLDAIVELGSHRISISGNGSFLKKEQGYQLIDFSKKPPLGEQVYPDISQNDGWLAIKNDDNHWTIFSKIPYVIQPIHQVDSLYIVSDGVCFFQKGDSSILQFQSEHFISLASDEGFSNLQYVNERGEPNSRFLKVSGNSHKVYSDSGKLLFEIEPATLDLLSDSLFAQKRNGQYGVISAEGKEILEVSYDAVDINDDLIFMLKGGKIGALDLTNENLINPEYEARINRFGAYYAVQKASKKGILDANGETLIEPQYEEVLYWNDTSFWAKENDTFSLLTFDEEILIADVLSLNLWVAEEGEQIYTILTATGTGLVSNNRGFLLDPQYNDLINVGAADTPLIFAEQHLKTALFYVVTYFNALFEPIKSFAYRPKEYQKIYCDQ